MMTKRRGAVGTRRFLIAVLGGMAAMAASPPF